MTSRQLKNRCRVIQSILDTPDFYSYLCAQADNDINKVIPLLSRIIDYALNSNVEHINFNKIPEGIQSDFVMYPTNSYFYGKLSLFGLSFFALNGKINKKLDKINDDVSFYGTDSSLNWFQAYGSTEEAINVAHTTPSTVFKHILKQPENNEQPIVVGATESSYYLGILEKRLKNKPDMSKTATTKAERTISTIVEKDSLLVVIPKDELDHDSLDHKQITDSIPRSKIGLIRIPSRYELIQICARNRNLKQGTKLSIKDGKPTTKKEERREDFELPFSYTRYEMVCVDDTFDYMADELTGDARYDMDIIYGHKDVHKTKETLSENPDINIRNIKNNTNSILLIKRNNKVWISNGRHRLVYLKNYYLDQLDYYESLGKTDGLKDYCTVIASVTKTYEDKEVIRILTELKKLNIRAYKNSSLDDEFNFVIMVNNYLYNVRNKFELIDFYNNIKNKRSNKLYEIALSKGNNHLETKYVINYLVNKFNTQIVKLSFSDVIEYIKFKGIKKDGLIFGIDYVDIHNLYMSFSSTVNIINYYILTNRELDLSNGIRF